jgi:competence protein ComEC
LTWGAGIFASRFLAPGLCVLLITVFAALQASNQNLPWGGFNTNADYSEAAPNKFCLLLFLFLSFGLGFGYAVWRTPIKPEFPAWLEAAIVPDADGERSEAYKNGLRIRARVDEVTGRTDRRLQLILSQARVLGHPQATSNSEHSTLLLPGRLALTWHLPITPEAYKPMAPGIPVFHSASRPGKTSLAPLPYRPLPGQEIDLLLRIRPVRGLKNPGLWNLESYWADQGVWLRASAAGMNAEASFPYRDTELSSSNGDTRTLLPDQNAGANSLHILLGYGRENIRQRVLAALPRIEATATQNARHAVSASALLAPGAEFLPALLFGDRFLLDSPDTELFARSTLMHSLALSGLHLGYAAALGYALALLLYRCFPQVGVRLPRQKFAAYLALVPALLYLWLGGAPPSLLRSALMLLFCGLLLFLRRPAVLLDSLFWAVAIILLADPLALFDLRLQLSVLAIAAIALSAPLLAAANTKLRQRILHGKQPTLPQKQRQDQHRNPSALKLAILRRPLSAVASCCLFTLGTSFAIQLALMPLLVKNFGLYGLAFPLNLLWLPVLGLVVMPLAFCGLTAAALNFSALAQICFQLAAIPCGWLMEFLRWLDQIGCLPVSLPTRPHWAFILGFWLLLALLPQIKKIIEGVWGKSFPPAGRRAEPHTNPTLVLLCLAIALCLFPLALRQYETSREAVRLRLLDVGQGQSVLLEWPGGGRLLLDGGGSISPRFNLGKDVVAATLTSNRPARLDYMLLSHPDLDHAQGLLFPLEHMEIGYYADNGPQQQARTDESVYPRLDELLRQKGLATNRLHAGQTLHLAENLRLDILHPPAETTERAKFDGNDASLVARLVWRGEPLALLCGDAEQKAQRFMLKTLEAPDHLRAQVLLLPHHGAAGAFLSEFITAAKPELALASSGYANRWGFPSKVARDGLSALNVPLLHTGESGQIIVEWSDGGKSRTVLTTR